MIVLTCECDKESWGRNSFELFSHQSVIFYSTTGELQKERPRKPELDRYLNKNLTRVKTEQTHLCTYKRTYIRTAACILYLRSGDDKCWPSGRVNVDMMKKILQRLAGCVRLVSIILRGGGGCATSRPLIIKPLHLREHRKWKAGLIGTGCTTGGENLKKSF